MTSTVDVETATLPDLLKSVREGDTVIITEGVDKTPVAPKSLHSQQVLAAWAF